MPELEEIVAVEITTPLPSEGVVDATYRIEGTVKMFDALGAPPWVYAEVLKKDWYKPEIIEEVHYERGFPMPVTGNFTIGWVPKKEGLYEVTVVATPAPLSLPMIGVSPITGKSDMMRVEVGKLVHQVKELKIVAYSKNGGAPVTPPTRLKVDPGDEIRVDVEFGYMGPGYRETLYSALYVRQWWGIDEVSGGAGTSAVDIPAATELTTVKSFVIVPVPNRPGETFGIYAKLGDWPPSKEWDNVIEVTGVPAPQVKNLRIVSYDSAAPGAKLKVNPGDEIRVNVEFDYRGPAWRETLYSALYVRQWWGIDEVSGGAGAEGWDIPEAPDWVTVTDCYVIVPVPNRPGETFGIHAKLGDIASKEWDDVIEVIGVAAPEVKNLRIVSYDSAAPGAKLKVNPGDEIRVNVEFDYRGPAWRETLYSALYVRQWWGIDEISGGAGAKGWDIPEAPDWVTVTDCYVIVPVPNRPGETFGIYAKLGEIASKEWDGVIEIVGVPVTPQIENVRIISYDSVTPPTKLTVTPYDRIRVYIAFDYQGPAYRETLYAALWKGYIFGHPDETAPATRALDIPACAEPSTISGSGVYVTITIPNRPDETFGLYVKVGPVECEPADRYKNLIEIVEVAPPPPLESPKGKTLAATDITHDSATILGELIDTGFWSNVDVYFQWGKTTAYGNETPKIRMYEAQEGQAFYAELLHLLESGRTYHYRAVVEAVGYRSEEVGPGYGSDMTFTTMTAPPVVSFTMRVRNVPSPATLWRAGYVLGGYPSMPVSQPLDYVWEWTKAVPDEEMDFSVWCGYPDPENPAHRFTVRYDRFPFRLKVSKNYAFDWSLPGGQRMIEI